MKSRKEKRMRRLLLLPVLLTSAPVAAQLSIQDPALSFYNKCLSEALEDKEVRKLGAQASYSCYSNTARSWFESLPGGKEVKDKNGLFVARYYGETGYCAHQIEDGSGKAVSAYICEIVNNSPN
jgi:hypothetical protein